MIAIVLLPVRNERLGGSGGPDYVTRAANSASARAKEFLHTHFTIVDRPPSEVGWLLGADTQLTL